VEVISLEVETQDINRKCEIYKGHLHFSETGIQFQEIPVQHLDFVQILRFPSFHFGVHPHIS